jgi:hypothetical protein
VQDRRKHDERAAAYHSQSQKSQRSQPDAQALQHRRNAQRPAECCAYREDRHCDHQNQAGYQALRYVECGDRGEALRERSQRTYSLADGVFDGPWQILDNAGQKAGDIEGEVSAV